MPATPPEIAGKGSVGRVLIFRALPGEHPELLKTSYSR